MKGFLLIFILLLLHFLYDLILSFKLLRANYGIIITSTEEAAVIAIVTIIQIMN